MTSQNGAGIHHPQGDIKMISTYSDPLLSTNYFDSNENTDGKYWRVVWSDTENGHGVTEGGSSGSAIYNSNGLLVGTLTGGQAACNLQTSPDWYGKFSYHWESNGNDSSTQLKCWLDPIGDGTEVLNGSDFDSSNLTADFTSDGVKVTIGGAIEFTNLSVGNITSYKWYFEGGYPATSNKNNPEPVRYFQSGIFDVKLIVKSANGADSLIRTDLIQVGSLIYPSISRGQVNLKIGNIASEKIIVKVFNAMGHELKDVPEPVVQGDGVLSLLLPDYDAGAYVILLDHDGFTQSYKFILVE
jgi:PKD repeat protein